MDIGGRGRSFQRCLCVIADTLAPVIYTLSLHDALPIFNSAPATGQTKVLVVKRLAFSYSTTGTLSAFGSCLFAGVTPSKDRTTPRLNSSHSSIPYTLGSVANVAFIDVAKTIATGVAWQL